MHNIVYNFPTLCQAQFWVYVQVNNNNSLVQLFFLADDASINPSFLLSFRGREDFIFNIVIVEHRCVMCIFQAIYRNVVTRFSNLCFNDGDAHFFGFRVCVYMLVLELVDRQNGSVFVLLHAIFAKFILRSRKNATTNVGVEGSWACTQARAHASSRFCYIWWLPQSFSFRAGKTNVEWLHFLLLHSV